MIALSSVIATGLAVEKICVFVYNCFNSSKEKDIDSSDFLNQSAIILDSSLDDSNNGNNKSVEEISFSNDESNLKRTLSNILTKDTSHDGVLIENEINQNSSREKDKKSLN